MNTYDDKTMATTVHTHMLRKHSATRTKKITVYHKNIIRNCVACLIIMLTLICAHMFINMEYRNACILISTHVCGCGG